MLGVAGVSPAGNGSDQRARLIARAVLLMRLKNAVHFFNGSSIIGKWARREGLFPQKNNKRNKQMFTKQDAKKILDENNQQHILKDFDFFSDSKKAEFLKQIENINWSDIKMIKKNSSAARGKFSVPPAVSITEIEQNKDKYLEAGIAAIKRGEVAAVLLAGGMGTRLVFNLPKGCFNVGLTHELFIFECLINNLLDVVKQCGVYVPLYIMTSEKMMMLPRSFLLNIITLVTTKIILSFLFRIWLVLLITMANFFLKIKADLQLLQTETAVGSLLW